MENFNFENRKFLIMQPTLQKFNLILQRCEIILKTPRKSNLKAGQTMDINKILTYNRYVIEQAIYLQQLIKPKTNLDKFIFNKYLEYLRLCGLKDFEFTSPTESSREIKIKLYDLIEGIPEFLASEDRFYIIEELFYTNRDCMNMGDLYVDRSSISNMVDEIFEVMINYYY